MTELTCPWSRTFDTLDPKCDELIRQAGEEADYLHSLGFWKWGEGAQSALAIYLANSSEPGLKAKMGLTWD